ncbi:MAG TPA: hypothetical protein VKA26_11070 [Ignavibacteriaceae bacterium]|nr:hypothetical protein [Ignavibacteriaceae bacterium]
MLKKTFTFLLFIIAVIFIIYGLSDFSLSSISSIVSLAVGIGIMGILLLSKYMSESDDK